MKKKLREFAKLMGLGLGYGMEKGGLVDQMQKHIDALSAEDFQTIPTPKRMGKDSISIEDLIQARDMMDMGHLGAAGDLTCRKFKLRDGIQLRIYRSKNTPQKYASWSQNGVQHPRVYDESLGKLIGKLRLEIAKATNPQVKEVHDRMSKKDAYYWGVDAGLQGPNGHVGISMSSPVTVLGGLKYKKVNAMTPPAIGTVVSDGMGNMKIWDGKGWKAP